MSGHGGQKLKNEWRWRSNFVHRGAAWFPLGERPGTWPRRGGCVGVNVFKGRRGSSASVNINVVALEMLGATAPSAAAAYKFGDH